MNEYISELKKNRLFQGVEHKNIEKILDCLIARRQDYKSGDMLIWEGDYVNDIGIVLSGRCRAVKTDMSGKVIIVSLLQKGDFIGVLLAASRDRKSPLSVQAESALTILYIPFGNLLRNGAACPQYDILLKNCFDSISDKSIELYHRIDCLIRPSLREKILTYLRMLAGGKTDITFMSPLDRSSMAEYVNADRSSLSRELSRMKKDGLVDYYKNSFKLL